MKKQNQLGMNPSTASHRLVKDILFSLVKDKPCYHCGQPLTRETFSVEHKVPWLDSDDPVKLFFDLDNIDFSHIGCNVRARRIEVAACGTASSYKKGCRCDACTKAIAADGRRFYTAQKRHARYKRTGN